MGVKICCACHELPLFHDYVPLEGRYMQYTVHYISGLVMKWILLQALLWMKPWQMIKIFLEKLGWWWILWLLQSRQNFSAIPKTASKLKTRHGGVGLMKYLLCIYASLIQFSNLHQFCVWKDLLALAFHEMAHFGKFKLPDPSLVSWSHFDALFLLILSGVLWGCNVSVRIVSITDQFFTHNKKHLEAHNAIPLQPGTRRARAFCSIYNWRDCSY